MFSIPDSSIGQNTQLYNEIKKLVRHETSINLRDNVSLLVAVRDKDSLYFFDMKNDENQKAQEELLPLGSFVEVFFAFYIFDLHHKGKIDLNTPLNDIYNINNPFFENTTLWDLFLHRSQLPKFQPDFTNKSELVNYLNAFQSEQEGFRYSQFGFQLLLNHISETLEVDPRRHMIALFEEEQFDFTMEGDEVKGSLRDLIRVCRFPIFHDTVVGEVPIFDSNGEITPQGFHAPWLVMHPKDYHDIYSFTGKTTGSQLYGAFVEATNTAVVVFKGDLEPSDGLYLHILRMLNNNWKN